MYFLEQIKNQFFSSIAVYTAGEGAMDISPRPQRRPEDEEQKPTPANLSPEQAAKLETLEGIKKEIEGLQASEKIVGQRITVIGGHLEKIKYTPTPGANPNDVEYGQLLGTYDRLVKEYDVLSKDNRALLIYLNDTLSKFEGEVDKEIAEIIGPVEEKDFSLEEVQALETKRAAEKETAEKTFITFLGAKYVAGTDLSTYAQNFVGTPFETTFKQYQEAIKAPEQKTDANADTYRNNMEHVNTKGQIYAYDIETFQDISAKNTITLRDERIIDGKKFGEIRDESAQSQLEKFVSETTDPELKEILSKNGETLKFSELSAAHIALLHEKGFDIKPFLFVNEMGGSISPEDYKNGGVFFLNTAGNKNLEGILEMNLMDETSQTLTIEGQLASYKEGENAGYYYPNGEKVILRDGMKIEVSPLGNMTPDEARTAATSTGFREIMGNEIGAQLNNTPEILQILEKLGTFGKFISQMLIGLGFVKNPDGSGGYGYTNASGEWVPMEENDFKESSRRSEPAERSASGTTLCSRTAFKNLTKLGVDNPHRGASARDSYEMYGKEGDTSFPKSDIAKGARFADIYLDASPKNAKYGHRAAAFKEGEQWFILDPYYSIPGYPDRQGAIPAEAYLNHMCGSKGRKFWGAQFPNGSSESPTETPIA